MEKHIPLVGWLNIGHGALTVLIAFVVLVTLVGVGVAIGDEDPEGRTVLIIVGTAVPAFLCLLAAPKIAGGIGVLRRAQWGRVVLLVLSFLSLIDFPLGTALGIYSIWVLVSEETTQLFSTRLGS